MVEALQGLDLALQPCQAFAASTVPALHVAAGGAQHPERTAEHTLAIAQKVGCTTEMTLFSRNYRGLPYPLGYETP